ncbi:MAG: DUF3078 domain-containing protein [Ferruginibacter sp.]
MKKILFFSMLVFICTAASAQDATVTELKKASDKSIKKDANDTIPQKWKLGGNFSLNINQGSLSNWSAGGDKFSFSLNSYLNLYAFYKQGKSSWDNSLDLAYGIVKTTSLGNRKAADRIDFLTKYGYAIGKKVNVAALLNFRSQFAKGYAYSKNSVGADSATLTSKTFQPAYLLLSLGIDYKPNKDLSIFVSPLTQRWVFVGDTLLGPGYGLDPGKKVKSELGAFLTANYLKTLGKNFTFKTRLDLFSNYKHEPQNIDVYWSNVLTAKLTKYINFSFNLDMIYDDDTKNINPNKGPAPQWLELMGVGFAYTFKNKK